MCPICLTTISEKSHKRYEMFQKENLSQKNLHTVHTKNPVGLARELDVANTCQKTAPSSVHKESLNYQPASIFP